MLHSLRSHLLALVAVAAVAALPVACTSGGVGDPCTPDEEYDALFDGFDIAENYLESRSLQCATRVCLVNYFQGRVSCPLGQSAADITPCAGPGDTACAAGQSCVVSDTLAQACDPCDPAKDAGCMPLSCPAGLTCDPARKLCTCDSSSPAVTVAGVSYGCGYFDPSCVPSASAPCAGLPTSYLCHAAGACQTAGATPAQNEGKVCCVPGSDTPVGVSVCGQCDAASQRDAEEAVYCSCRCAVADGDPPEPDFEFCACPTGFSCSEIRPDLHLTDQQLTGKYCVKAGTASNGDSAVTCGIVAGNHASPCAGLGAE
jgi:hypothetical protein